MRSRLCLAFFLILFCLKGLSAAVCQKATCTDLDPSKTITGATLYVMDDDQGDFYINGNYLYHPANWGTPVVASVPLGWLVPSPGQNVIASTIYDYAAGDGQMTYDLIITYSDGSTQEIASDVSQAPIHYFYDGLNTPGPLVFAPNDGSGRAWQNPAYVEGPGWAPAPNYATKCFAGWGELSYLCGGIIPWVGVLPCGGETLYNTFSFRQNFSLCPYIVPTPTPVGACQINTIAGTGIAGFSGDGAAATTAMLNQPYGVAVDASGNVFVGDTGNFRVRKVDGLGKISTIAGTGTGGYNGDGSPSTAYQVNAGQGAVAVDGAGNVYVADTNNFRVRKITPAGVISTVVGTGINGFSGDGGPATAARISNVSGLYVDAGGTLYISDLVNNRIRKVTPGGIISTIAGTGTGGFSGDGGAATSAQMSAPGGIFADAAGNVYFSDTANNRVRKISAGGIITTVAGGGIANPGDGGPATSASIHPYGIVLDNCGNLVFADQGYNRIRLVDKVTGIISTIVDTAGAGGYAGDGGPGSAAKINAAMNLAIDAAGDIYIADRGNSAIRKFRPCILCSSTTPTPSGTPTPTPSATDSPTPTPSATQTPTPSATLTATPSASPTFTATPSASPTSTPSSTPTATRSATATASNSPSLTFTPTPSPTVSPSSTATETRSATATDSPTPTLSATQTHTPSATPTATPSVSPTLTVTPSASPTSTPSSTPTATRSATATASPSATPSASLTATPSNSPSLTFTPTPSPTVTPSSTPTVTRSATATDSPTPTLSATQTHTPSATPTATPSASPTLTATPSASPTSTPSSTSTATRSATATASPSATPSASLTATPSNSPSLTFTPTSSPTASPSSTPTETRSATATDSPSPTPSATQTPTPSVTPTATPSASPTLTATPSASPTSTPTSTSTATRSATATASPSATQTPTPSASPTDSPSPTPSATQTPTPSASPTETPSASPTLTVTPSASPTLTATATRTFSVTVSSTSTTSSTPSATVTGTVSETPSPSSSATPSLTSTATSSATRTVTSGPTPTFTLSYSATASRTATSTLTQTPTLTASLSDTPTGTFSPTLSASLTPSPSPTFSATPPATPTFSVSPTATPTFVAHFFSTIGIYNSAGEKVKVLVSGLPSQASPALDFALSSSTCAPGSGLAFWAKAGGKSFGWDGGNDGGQQIQNGLYYVKLEYRDPFGHVESVTHEVTVLGANQAAKVLIYNSAGELVRQLGVPSVPGSPPSRLQPDKASLAASQTVGPFGQIVFDLGNGSSVSWDGSNASGQKVAGGTYVAQLVVSSGQGPKIVASSPVSVINAPESLLAGAQLAPNPLRATTGGTKDAYLKFNAAPGVEVVGRLYNLAGELILTCTNDMNPGELHFGATALKASSGVYVLAVTAKAPWGTVERKNYKWVMLR